MRSFQDRRDWSREGRICVAALALALMWPAGLATAQTVYFGDGYGVDPAGENVEFSATPFDQINAEGIDAPEDQLSWADLVVSWPEAPTAVINRPQDDGQIPSLTNPYIADVLVTIQNVTGTAGSQKPGRTIQGALAFTQPITLPVAEHVGIYPDASRAFIGLDISEPNYGLLRYSGSVLSPDPILPAFLFGLLQPGESTSFLVRQVIATEMLASQSNGGGVELPRIGVTAFESVYEPARMTLLVVGLFSLAFIRRRS